MAQISSKNCELCNENNGVFYCYECQHALCDLCRRKHDKIPSTRGHTVTVIQNVDLATFNSKSQCVSHEREFMFYCVKCSDLICSKCVTTTHKDHAVSEIAEMISNEREQGKNTLPEIKAKIEDISALKENVRCNHLEKLKKDSKHVVEDIESTYQELRLFIESKKDIRITEIEDNEKLERQNLESFLQNIGHVTKHFSRAFSELENILSEKHDITFFTSYKTLQVDINHLDNVPEPPKLVEVKRFDKRMFYKEIVDNILSKVGDSICKHCAEKTTTIDDMQKERRNLEENLNRGIKKKDDELEMFKQKIDTLEKKFRDAELRATQNIQMKDDELKILRQEIESLKNKNEEEEYETCEGDTIFEERDEDSDVDQGTLITETCEGDTIFQERDEDSDVDQGTLIQFHGLSYPLYPVYPYGASQPPGVVPRQYPPRTSLSPGLRPWQYPPGTSLPPGVVPRQYPPGTSQPPGLRPWQYPPGTSQPPGLVPRQYPPGTRFYGDDKRYEED